MSENVAMALGSGSPAARQINVTAWALVQPFAGRKWPLPSPTVILFSTAQLIALRNSSDLGMSVNWSVTVTSGLFLERYRKVTIWSLVQVLPGLNLLPPVPAVMLMSTAHFTGVAK